MWAGTCYFAAATGNLAYVIIEWLRERTEYIPQQQTEKIARKVYEQLFENYSARLRYFALKVTPACSFHRSAHGEYFLNKILCLITKIYTIIIVKY